MGDALLLQEVDILILLCVDGIDPDLVLEFGWGKLFKNNYSLKIPRECYVPDPDLGSTPHTTRVWPTIFSGKIIDYGLIRRKGPRKILHNILVKAGITWNRTRPRYRIAPHNVDLNTIFDEFHSFIWNIPTISPEWIASFPSFEDFVEHSKREFGMWIRMTYGALFLETPLQAYYLRYVDYVGHQSPEKLREAYSTIFLHAHELKRKTDVILLSDHGTGLDRNHTERAYLGSDHSFRAEWVNELRLDFERIFTMMEIERK